MSTETPSPPARSQLRSRLTLLLVAVAFMSPFLIAAALFFGGWKPEGRRNHGELLQPPVALGDLALQRAEGSAWAWQPERNAWRFLVVPPAQCAAQACERTLDTLHRLWVGQGRKADRIEVMWFGPLPAGTRFRNLIAMQPSPALAARLPEAARADALPIYLVDPNGFLVLHYRPGYEPAGVRKDLGKLVK